LTSGGRYSSASENAITTGTCAQGAKSSKEAFRVVDGWQTNEITTPNQEWEPARTTRLHATAYLDMRKHGLQLGLAEIGTEQVIRRALAAGQTEQPARRDGRKVQCRIQDGVG